MTPLRTGVLNLWEVLAQSIAMLGPTLTPVLIVPLMFASAGNASWLAYAFGSLLLLAIAFNIREFAIRSSSAGSLYEFARRAFGARGSALCGWTLLWAYGLVGIAGLTGFVVFAKALVGMAHASVPGIAALTFCLVVALAFAYRDIRLSTITLLLIEASSVTVITVLLALVIAHHGTLVDPDQLQLRGTKLSGIALGTTIAIFSLVGFESATALGEEARDPLRTIPAAVILSVIVSGVFFVVCAYVEVLGAHGLSATLDKLGTPLDALADAARVPAFKVAIDAGAMLSAFSITLAAMNASARIAFDMSRTRVFPSLLGRTHQTFRTPHVALVAFALVCGAVGGGMLLGGISPLESFNDTATLGSFGFITIYAFVTLGAPVYLRRIGALRSRHIVVAAVTLALLLIPAVGSVYPVPPAPTNAFPYIFAGYVLLGIGMLWRSAGRRDDAAFPPEASSG